MTDERQFSQRRSERVDLEANVEFFLDADIIEAEMVDVSQTGMCFSSSQPLLLEMRITMQGAMEERRAKLVWAQTDQSGKLRIGLEFVGEPILPQESAAPLQGAVKSPPQTLDKVKVGERRVRSAIVERPTPHQIMDRLGEVRLLPLYAGSVIGETLALCHALKKADMAQMILQFKNPRVPELISAIHRQIPGFLIGASNITTQTELEAAHAAGADFALAPGLNPRVAQRARELEMPFIPGVATPGEVEAALDLGLSLLHLYPAHILGEQQGLKALYDPYAHRGLGFLVTGGVGPSNGAAYLQHPGVVAVGGDWFLSPHSMEQENWAEITVHARRAARAMK